MKNLLTLLFLIMFSSVIFPDPLKLVLPLDEGTAAYEMHVVLLNEIVRRTGLEMTAVHYPRNRMFFMLSYRSDDIEGVLRCPGEINETEQTYCEELIKIETPIDLTEIIAITSRKDLEYTGWESLRGYRLTCVRGSKVIEEKLNQLGLEAFETNYLRQNIEMVNMGRMDVLITSRLQMESLMDCDICSNLIILEPPLQVSPFYTYFYPRFRKEAAAFEKALKEMIADGTYTTIMKGFISSSQ